MVISPEHQCFGSLPFDMKALKILHMSCCSSSVEFFIISLVIASAPADFPFFSLLMALEISSCFIRELRSMSGRGGTVGWGRWLIVSC